MYSQLIFRIEMESYFQLFFLEFVNDIQYSRSDFQHLQNEANQNKQVNSLK